MPCEVKKGRQEKRSNSADRYCHCSPAKLRKLENFNRLEIKINTRANSLVTATFGSGKKIMLATFGVDCYD